MSEEKLMDSTLGKVLAGVLTTVILGGITQAVAIYTWVKVADSRLVDLSNDVTEIKADLKNATSDRYRRQEAQEAHRAMWQAIREHKHR